MPKRKNDFEMDYSNYGFKVEDKPFYRTKPGLSEQIVREISAIKSEPRWMLDIRLKALEVFYKKPLPKWGSDLSSIDFDQFTYYIKSSEKNSDSWSDVPEDIKNTFDRLGIPEAERKFLGGMGAQFESEMVYHHMQEELTSKGIIFCGMDTALREHPALVKKYFGSVVPMSDNKFAALNTAVWSGGSFIYVPKGVVIERPLQAYFRINAENMGQFERTLIIADEGSVVPYVEGCTAPIYSKGSLHAAVVELIALKGSRIRYTTIQNWSTNVYNLVTKRAFAHEDSYIEWIDGNLGSRLTMKYPAVYLFGKGSRAEIMSIAFAGKGQIQDAGGKVVHLAPNTSSTITNKSISKDGGRTIYRGLVRVAKGAVGSKTAVKCDALILDDRSSSETVPFMDINESRISMAHEATSGKISEEQLFYLMSRGIAEEEAMNMIVQGFVEPFTKLLPMEYAVELNRLISLEMEGSVG